MAMEFEGVNAHFSNHVDEAHIEQMLSEKLMDGYVLLEKNCPSCSTPLVKIHANGDLLAKSSEVAPVLVPSQSFEKPFKPVPGVPLCVACSAHVVTQENEVGYLERCDSLRAKGGILVAMTESASTADSTVTERPDPSVSEPDIIDVSVLEPEVIDVTRVEEPVEEEEEVMAEYSVRREIATKVLGAKMLQGYSLLEVQCDKCGMPMMEKQGAIDCVVCPALAKKAKKKLKAQQKLAAEQQRLEREIESVKQKQAEQEEKARVLFLLADQKRQEEALRQEMERMAASAKQTRSTEMEAEQARLFAAAKEEVARESLRKQQEEEMASIKKQEQEQQLEDLKRTKAERIEQEYAEATQKRQLIEIKLMEETKRLEEMEQRHKMGIATAFEKNSRDVLATEHRKRLEEKIQLDAEIARLDENRTEQSLVWRQLADEQRAEEEAKMIATLEEEAAAKAKAAEDAIRKAKAALEHVNTARREVIAQTIAMAEEEAVAEAESQIKKEREDYKAPVILPTASEIKSENWETLRVEGRSVMTRRVMAGWTLLADFCKGTECHNSPLITKDGITECVVCGGCGDGTDGAYIENEDYDIVPTEAELQMMRETGVAPMEASGYEITPTTPKAPSPEQSVEEIQEDFESKRITVSKEIGKRMIEGWTLLDASCPVCVMPLMMDNKGVSNICVMHGPVSHLIAQAKAAESEPEDDMPDVATLDSSLPTIQQKASEDVPSDEEKEGEEKKEDEATTTTNDLAESIRLNAEKQTKGHSTTPRNDPPAARKTQAKSGAKAPVETPADETPVAEAPKLTIDPSSAETSTPKVEDEDVVHESIEMDIETSSEIMSPTPKAKLTADDISDMFMFSPMGQDLQGVDTLSAIADLVDIFVTTNVDEEVSSKVKADVITEVKHRIQEKNGDVIHLDHVSSPQNFTFEEKERKSKPSPETMGRPRSKVPRPSPRSRPPRTPTRSLTPRGRGKNGFYVVGGPSDFDARSMGEGSRASRAESVASDAIDTILDKIENAKASLLRDDISVKDQLDAANLIEKLAQAAVAVKALEKLDM